MTRPIDLTQVVNDLVKRVEALEARDKMAEDPNILARMPREERRARLGLSSLHEGVRDHRDIPVLEDPIEVIKVDPIVVEPVPIKDSS